jgi:hypothetical protein
MRQTKSVVRPSLWLISLRRANALDLKLLTLNWIGVCAVPLSFGEFGDGIWISSDDGKKLPFTADNDLLDRLNAP